VRYRVRVSADPRRYMQVAAVLRDRIASGQIPAGAAMPGTRAIKDEFGVSIETAQKSLKVLADEGLIRRWAGLPYHVI
jgi:DNA-binding GntR family transcriptional regulator